VSFIAPPGGAAAAAATPSASASASIAARHRPVVAVQSINGDNCGAAWRTKRDGVM